MEMYARRRRPGWDAYGWEAGDDHPLLKPLFPPPIQMPS